MASKLVKRTLELIGGEVKTKVKDYTSNLNSFTSDAREIKDILIKGETNAADSFQKLKKTGVTKRISDWFYGEENDFDNSNSDEFDPGFSSAGSDENPLDGDKKQTSLTYDTMKEISSKQTGMMLKIGRRQTEQSVANTAEVISVVNNRTAEMITAMNNINTSLKGVNERLDTLIKLQKFGIEVEDERASSEGGVYDSNGNLSLKGIFNSAKNNVTGGLLGQFLSAAKDGIGPEMIFGLAIDSLLGKPINSLGGQSVNDLGKQFNDMIGNVVQTSLSSMIQSDTFKRLFGSVTGFDADKDYGTLYNPKYDTKRAQFDNMTRHTIVKIMPELLIKLNENLSGRSYHINQSGALIEGPAPNMFQKTIDDTLAGVGTGISAPALKRIESGMKKVFKEPIPQADINEAGKALVDAFIFQCHNAGDIVVTRQSLGGDNTEAISNAVEFILAKNSSKSASYWAKVCQVILYQMAAGKMDSHTFIANINTAVGSLQRNASNHAQNSIYGYQAGRITKEAIKTAYVNNSTINTDDETNKEQIKRAATAVFKDKYTSADYVRGIFGLLNRGINVKVAGKKGSNTYGRFTANDIMRDPFTNQTNNDDKAAQMFVQAITGNTDEIKNSMNEALGLLDTAEAIAGMPGTSGGVLGKIRGLVSTGSNLSTLVTNLRSNKLLGDMRAAVKGDSSGLKKRIDPYHDDIEFATNLAQGVGNMAVDRGRVLAGNVKNAVVNSRFGQAVHRDINNRLYDYDTHTRNNAIKNIRNADVSYIPQDQQIAYARTIKAIEKNGYSGQDLTGYGADSEYIQSQLDIINRIDTKRTNVQGKPNIGAVRMAAPNSDHGSMYNLVKKGFSTTTKILGSLAKLAKSGLQDIYYGFGSAIQGMFGGPRKDIKSGKTSMHRGLIGDMTWGLGQLGFHYTSKVAKGVASGVAGLARKGWQSYQEGDSGEFVPDVRMDRNLTRAELKDYNRQTYLKEHGDDIISANYQHYDEDGKWHAKAVTYGDGTKVAKEGTVVTKADLAKNPVKAIGKTVVNVVGKLSYFGEAITNAAKTIKSFTSKVLTWTKNTFRKTSFGKGFLEGFDKARIAKQAKLDQKEENGSWFNRMFGKVARVITGEDKSTESPLTKICDLLGSIVINTKPKEEKPEINNQNNTATDQNGNNTTGESGAVGTAFTANKNSSESEGTEGQSSYTYTKQKKTGFFAKAGEVLQKGKETAIGQYASGALENIGKIVGGISQGIGGILKIAISVLTAMEGFQAIKDLVQEIFTKGLKPLNQVFQQVYKMIKPIVKQLTGIVKDIASSLAQMLDGVLKTLTPLLKMISDAIETIFDTILKPVMEILDATLSACMVPITLVLDAMKPQIDMICNDLKIVSGVVQLGMGGVMGLLGGIASGIGAAVSGIGKILRWAKLKSAGNKLIDTGAQVSKTGASMLEHAAALVKSGAQQLKDGIAGQLQVIKNIATGEYLKNEEEETKETVVDQERLNNVNLDNNGANFGSGDINNYNTWNYTYGSGNSTMNQHTYGPTMNMSERGCGPVALADAYNRRNGGNMNPLTLASRMMGSGSYDPNRGTSVTSMITTGNALGMNMRAGGVTQRSLNGASPSNPITVIGSGSGFGTKRGNDHYLNVLGSDGHGNSYVSNPMNGRVSRTPTSQLALNSRLGLYGSGDALPDEFGINDEAADALNRLKQLSERFTKIFTGDSTVDKVNKTINAGKEDNLSKSLDAQLGDISDEDKKALETTEAEALAKQDFGEKQANESQEEYDARFAKWYKGKEQTYINKAKQIYIAGKLQANKDDMDKSSGNVLSWFDQAKRDYENMATVAGDKSGLDGGDDSDITSTQGAIMSAFSPIAFTETNITSGTDYKSPVHNYFAVTSEAYTTDNSNNFADSKMKTIDGGWYKKGYSPNKEGEGQNNGTYTSDTHGVVIRYDGLRSYPPTVHAITPGTIVYVGKSGDLANKDPHGGYGNSVKWRDAAGMYHWYMGLTEIDDKIAEGNNIGENQVIGTMGHTGILDRKGMDQMVDNISKGDDPETNLGNMLRYIVTKTGGKQIGDEVNPLTYWQYDPSSAGTADASNLTGSKPSEKVFNFLAGLFGNKIGAAGAVGVMMSEGLFDDGAYNAPATLEGHSTKESDMSSKYGDIDKLDKYAREELFPAYASRGTSINKSGYNSEGKFLPGIGIAQWTGGRARKFLDYAKGHNEKWGDLSTQLNFLQSEESSYSGLFNFMKTVASVEDAANAWMTQYEAGQSGMNTTRISESAKADRRRNAQTAWNAYGNGSNTTVEASNPAGIQVNGSGKFISSARGYSDGAGYFTSDDGVALNIPYSNIEITDTNIQGENDYHSPLFEYFAKTTMGGKIGDITSSSWYKLRHNPNSEGVGSSGDNHSGVDFWGPGIAGKPLYATTGGKVVHKNYQADGGGNMLVWQDSAGYNHWYMHMVEPSTLNVNDTVNPGDLIGYVGTTGESSGEHLHYSINKGTISSSGNNAVNPLTYFKNYNPDAGKEKEESVVEYLDTSKDYASVLGSDYSPASQVVKALQIQNHSPAGIRSAGNGLTGIDLSGNSNGGVKSWLTGAKDRVLGLADGSNTSNTNSDTIEYKGQKYNKSFLLKNYRLLGISDAEMYKLGLLGTTTTSSSKDETITYKGVQYKKSFLLKNYKLLGISDTEMYNLGLMEPTAEEIEIDKKMANLMGKTYLDTSSNDTSNVVDVFGGINGSNATLSSIMNKGKSIIGRGDSEIPPIDLGSLDDYSSTNQSTGTTQIFNISRDDSTTVKLLDRISKMTFNVRNERVEELLAELVEYAKNKKKETGTNKQTTKSSNESIDDLFDDDIPEAVVRLSKG